MLIEVSESSQAGEARRKAIAIADELQMGESRRGAVALATTEMATNLVKHAGKGHILIQRILQGKTAGLRLMSVDKGPGIEDVSRALADGIPLPTPWGSDWARSRGSPTLSTFIRFRGQAR